MGDKLKEKPATLHQVTEKANTGHDQPVSKNSPPTIT